MFILDKRPNAAYVGELLDPWILGSVGDKEDDFAYTISILAVDILRSGSLICLHRKPQRQGKGDAMSLSCALLVLYHRQAIAAKPFA